MTDIELIKQRVNIIDEISTYVHLKKRGINYFGLCPFHKERTPSFSVNEQLQLFKCFGCGESGDVISFLMKAKNLDFRNVVQELAEKYSINLESLKSREAQDLIKQKNKLIEINEIASNFFLNKLTQDKSNKGYEYCVKRKMTDQLIDTFGIGYASLEYHNLSNFLVHKGYDKHYIIKAGLCVETKSGVSDKFKERLMFAIYDERGRIIGFSGRYIGSNNGEYTPPKYLNSPETVIFKKSKTIFGLYQAKQAIANLNFIILVEGQMNVISSHRVGIKNIVATMGTSITNEHINLLKKYSKNIYLALDNDVAGKKALIRTLELCFDNEVMPKIIAWDPVFGKDPDELINKSSDYWIEVVGTPEDPIEFFYYSFMKKYRVPDREKIQKFLKFCVKLISKVKDPLASEYNIKFLADKFGLSLDVLKSAIKTKEIELHVPFFQNLPVTNDSALNVIDIFFAMIIQFWNESKNILLTINSEILPESYIHLYDFLIDKIDIEALANIIPESVLGEKITNLMMTTIYIQPEISIEAHLIKLLPEFERRCKDISVKEIMKSDEDEDIKLEKIHRLLKN